MKYYLASVKNGVSGFIISNENIIIKNKGKQLLLNNNMLFQFAYDFFAKNGIIFSNQESECLFYDLEKQTFGCVKNKLMILFNNKDNDSELLFVDYLKNNRLHLFNYQTNTDKILLQNYDWEFLYLTKKELFIYNKNLLKSLSLLTGLYEWEVDLGLQGLEVGGILGIADTNLMVACTNKQHQTIWLSLDVVTGKEIWRRNLQISYGGTYTFNEDTTSAIILHAGGAWLNGIQVTKGNNLFREINTKDGSVRREGILLQMDEIGLGIYHCILHENLIYFTANYNGSFGAIVVGVLDYETLSLLWWEEVKMDEADGFGNFLLQIQVSENKIYVLDKTGTLHIYERDDTKPYPKPTKSGLMPFEYLPIPEKPPYYPENDDLPF